MSSAPHQLGRARFEDVEFLRSHPELLAEAEAVLGACADSVGGVESGSPPLSLTETDNWLSPSREKAQPSFLLPRAVIPLPTTPAEMPPTTPAEIASFQRESAEDSPARPLPQGWLHALPKPNLGENNEVIRLGDGTGPNQPQARALAHLGLVEKANRLASCGQLGRRVECTRGHLFFERSGAASATVPPAVPIIFRRSLRNTSGSKPWRRPGPSVWWPSWILRSATRGRSRTRRRSAA